MVQWSPDTNRDQPGGYYYDDYSYDDPYYYPSGYSGDPRAICAQNFRSFEWNGHGPYRLHARLKAGDLRLYSKAPL